MPKSRRRFPSQVLGKPKEHREYYEERRQKTWTFHDLETLHLLTDAQLEMFRIFRDGYNLIAFGTAGTGKTFIGLYLALREIFDPQSKTNNITLVRSAVQSRDMGFMPGTLEEKISLYEVPYRDMLCELVGRYSTYDDMKVAGLIQFCTTSFVRGLTWNNSIVIIDEVQNMTFHEINSVITRLGEHSRLIVLGDLAQGDLLKRKQETTGMDRLLRIAEHMDEMKTVEFTHEDIVRSDFVKAWIIACENTE